MTEPAEQPTTSDPAPPPTPASARRDEWLWAGLIVLLTLIVYQPAVRGMFLWDDNRYAMFGVNAPLVREPGGLAKIWFHPSTAGTSSDQFTTVQYYPLTFTAFWLQYQVWGLNTLGHHLLNIVLHACSGLLLWQLLKLMRIRGAWVAGAVFAVHPIEVESVAWITELKNVLSGLFLLASIYAYLRFAAPRETSAIDSDTDPMTPSTDVNWAWYAAAFVLFACAVFSKTVTSLMPVVAGIILYWRFRHRVNVKTVLGVVPFLLLGAVLSRQTAWMEKHVVLADGPDWTLSFTQRILIAGHAFWFYLGKLVAPLNLLFTYPRWDLTSPRPIDWAYVAAAIVVIAGSAAWLLVGRRRRAVPAAILAYAVLLFPAMGFFDVYPFRYSFVADHFQYHAGIAIIALIVGGIASRVWRGERAPGAQVVQGVVAAMILVLAVLTWRQSSIYNDPITLWLDTTTRNPSAWMAQYNLGSELARRAITRRAGGDAEGAANDFADAEKAFERCVAIRPQHANAYGNWGTILLETGRYPDAVDKLERAIQLDATKDEFHLNLGLVRLSTSRPADARAEFEKAIALDPKAWRPYFQLGKLLVSQGDLVGAEAALRKAEQLRPDDPAVQYALGSLLSREHKTKEALVHIGRAYNLQPDNPETLATLGYLWGEVGDRAKSFESFRRALEIDPQNQHALAGAKTLIDAVAQARRARHHSFDDRREHDARDDLAGDHRDRQVTPPGRASRRPLPIPAAAALIALLVIAAYVPAINGGWIWDDDQYVTRNTTVRTTAGLWRIWLEPTASPQYYPATMTTFWAEYHLWGLRPLGYHLDNVLLHAGSAVLLWRLLVRLGVRGAWFAAAAWALHPINAESVAWVTERKNVLSGLFYLAAATVYLRRLSLAPESEEPCAPAPGDYMMAVVLFILAPLSKTVTSTLPAALLLVLWWKRGRLTRRDVLPLLPFFALSLAAGVMTSHIERAHVGATGTAFDFSVPDRLLIASRAACFYAAKLIVPYTLSFIYPRWQLDPWNLLQWVPLVLCVVVTALLIRSVWRRRNSDLGALAGWLFFLGTLTPALGFFNVYPMRFSFVADHFQYLAGVGVIALVTVWVVRWFPRDRRILISAAAVTLATLGILTAIRAAVLADAESLWRDTIAKNPDAWMARTNLGTLLTDRAPAEWAAGDRARAAADLADAESQFDAAWRLRPDLPEPLMDIGRVYELRGELATAATWMRRAVDLAPASAEPHFHLGRILAASGDTATAVAEYRRAIELNPRHEPALVNLGALLADQRHFDEAITLYRRSLAIDPDSVFARTNLANALLATGDVCAAADEYRHVLAIEPGFAPAEQGLRRASATPTTEPAR